MMDKFSSEEIKSLESATDLFELMVDYDSHFTSNQTKEPTNDGQQQSKE